MATPQPQLGVGAALRLAAPMNLERDVVANCLDPSMRPNDSIFLKAFDESLAALELSERGGALAGVTGHVAESVVETILEEHGWIPVWHFTGPGRHGVDLLLLGPGTERMFAIEVKGTLRARIWPHLRRRELVNQMDLAWLDKSDNPGMGDWVLRSDDVYGAVALVDVGELAYKVALTSDFVHWHPMMEDSQLDNLDWLDRS
jgi:hypothetical protein